MVLAKTILTIAVIGLIIFFTSVAMFFVFPEMVANKVKQQLPLREGAPVLAKWSKVSVPIHFKVYVYDIVNADEFARGSQPVVKQRGPYTFLETREKVIDSFSNDTTTIFYDDIKKFYFQPDLSDGSLDDEVDVINVPLMGIIQKLYALKRRIPTVGSLVIPKANNLIANTGEQLVMRKKVRELLFEGYHIQLFEGLAKFAGGFGIDFKSPLPNNTFGAFFNKNGSSPGQYAINTGTRNVMDLGQIQTFKSRPRVPHWSGDSCNQINGTDGSGFHPRIKKHETLYLFNVDTCRSLYLRFEKESSVRGIPTYKFSVPDKFFKAPAVEPENACFCTHEEGLQHPLCSTDGLLDISRCKKGAPIVLSAPHFYKGDYRLRENVLGLDPQKSKHQTFLEIEPMTGLVLNAARRIQINVNVRNLPDFPAVERVSDVVMPFIWVEEIATADEVSANRFKSLIQNKLIIGNALIICFMVLGLAIFLICIIFLYIRRRRDRKLLEALNSSPDIKSSYSSLPMKDGGTVAS